MGTKQTQNRSETEEITIRMLGRDDEEALRGLADRDSAPAPVGAVLGAFVAGELVAAASIAGAATIADPFTPTDHLRSLLKRRARQMRGSSRLGGRLKRLLTQRSRAALPSSPPGGGGRFVIPPPPSSSR